MSLFDAVLCHYFAPIWCPFWSSGLKKGGLRKGPGTLWTLTMQQFWGRIYGPGSIKGQFLGNYRLISKIMIHPVEQPKGIEYRAGVPEGSLSVAHTMPIWHASYPRVPKKEAQKNSWKHTDSWKRRDAHTKGSYVRFQQLPLNVIQTPHDNSKRSLIHIWGSNICAQVTQHCSA